MVNKKELIGLSEDELYSDLALLGFEPFRVKQIWFWVYSQGIRDFSLMTNLSVKQRILLDDMFTLADPNISKDLTSFDGTRKWLLKFPDGNEIETVFIPDDNRGTVCISSQVGCTLTCKFCYTGTQKLVRNLLAGEIVKQFMHVKDVFGDWPSTKESRKVTNIVMMGMGEPLLNYDNVCKALKIIIDPNGLSLSKRKITLSTSGIVPLIYKCGEDLGVNLAISLHAVTNELRDELVPINKRYPIEQLIDACRKYPSLKNRGRITFEYVMLKDVNDSLNDAKALINLIKGIPSKINLIPFNAWPGSHFKCSSDRQIREFSKIIEDAGYMAPVRKPRGQDILAACGQLKSESIKPARSLMVP
jgi:23S rRNA (adenine2503-C2)-methyltransferase